MNTAEPTARTTFFSAVVGSDTYLWGGYTDGSTDHLSAINVCRHSSGTWFKQDITGKPPTGYYAGACAGLGSSLYMYGGRSKDGSDTGCLFELNTVTLFCKELSAHADDGPLKKIRCGMVAFEDHLVVFGGYSDSSEQIQPGSKCILGFTNELHSYNFKSGMYICQLRHLFMCLMFRPGKLG